MSDEILLSDNDEEKNSDDKSNGSEIDTGNEASQDKPELSHIDNIQNIDGDTEYIERDAASENKTEDRIWNKISTSKFILICNGLLVIATFLAVLVSFYQARISQNALEYSKTSSQESTRLIERLIVANEKLAEAANSQSEASKQQAESMIQSVDAAQSSARAAEESTKLAKQSLLHGQRAYVVPTMGLFENLAQGNKIKCKLTFENTGNTPALNFGGWVYIKLMNTSSPVPKPTRPLKANDTVTIFGPKGRIEINLESDDVLDHGTLELIRQNKLKIYVLGKMFYNDVLGESQELLICGYYNGTGNNMGICTNKEN